MRVLAINDISCVGKCSLSVSLPVISACGVTCDVLPTAMLSTHTGGFQGYTYRDLTEDFPAILSHWKMLGMRFDYIYSGYLGSIDQIDLVLQIRAQFLSDGGKFIVDPVMGDSGKLYAGFSDAFVEKMKTLCRRADYILPNATEACHLADVPYAEALPIDTVLENLRALCPRPIITGILESGVNSVYYTENGKHKRYSTQNVDGFFCGAGDVFASAFVGCLARGKAESEAIALAADFVTASIRRSSTEVEDKRYGLNFEAEIFSFLQKLNEYKK